MNELALFAGAGGGILGGHLLGWRTVCAVEYEPYAAGVLISRQNDGILPPFPIWDDVRTFDGKPWRGIVDVVSGGFPCQDISSAGKGAGIDGERSGLWGEMARIIGEVRPRFAFVENSPILTSRGLGRVLGDLASMGYDAEWCVLGAADVGAPHKRDRIWILAHTEGQRHWTRGESRNIREENGGPQHGLRPEPASTGAQAGELAHTESCAMRYERQNIRPRCYKVAKSCDRCSNFIRHDRLENWAIVAHTNSSQCQRGSISSRTCQEHSDIRCSSWWTVEPDVGRVAHGVAARVDRLKAIGNGQVPAVAATAFMKLIAAQRGEVEK